MRHLWSLIAGVVAAPLAWLLLATGQHRSQATVDAWDAAGAFDTVELIGPAAFLAAAGVLLGVVGTLRWSPVGPLVAGVLFVVPTVLMFINPFRIIDEVPDTWRLLSQDLAPRLPVENGTLPVLGVLLLMAVFSRQRWRRWPATPVAAPVVAGTAAEGGTAAGAGIGPGTGIESAADVGSGAPADREPEAEPEPQEPEPRGLESPESPDQEPPARDPQQSDQEPSDQEPSDEEPPGAGPSEEEPTGPERPGTSTAGSS